jgi:hypothetical protein
MFSVRETPWHGLGAVLAQPPASIAEAIDASGLGWRVKREPIAVDRGDAATVDDWWEPRCEEIPGYYATVRQDTRTVLGIVGERYRIVQNEEAFQFVDQFLGSSLHFETAGSLNGGRRVWVLATLPAHVEVGWDHPGRCGDHPRRSGEPSFWGGGGPVNAPGRASSSAANAAQACVHERRRRHECGSVTTPRSKACRAGNGRADPLTSKGPSDASAAVFRIRES